MNEPVTAYEAAVETLATLYPEHYRGLVRDHILCAPDPFTQPWYEAYCQQEGCRGWNRGSVSKADIIERHAAHHALCHRGLPLTEPRLTLSPDGSSSNVIEVSASRDGGDLP